MAPKKPFVETMELYTKQPKFKKRFASEKLETLYITPEVLAAMGWTEGDSIKVTITVA